VWCPSFESGVASDAAGRRHELRLSLNAIWLSVNPARKSVIYNHLDTSGMGGEIPLHAPVAHSEFVLTTKFSAVEASRQELIFGNDLPGSGKASYASDGVL
jgi:hypothetical protein